jgi:colicin import membrane protein
MSAPNRTGAILAIRPDGAAVVHAAGQRIEIPGGDVDETRLTAVTGLTSAASAAGAPIATLIVEATAVRAAMIAGDGFEVGDVLDAETAAAIDVDEDGSVHVQLHDLQVDVEGEDVRVAALTLVADVAAALERSVAVTATEAGVVRHLQVGADGALVLQEAATTSAPEEPAPTPGPKPRAVKAARPRRGRAAPVAAPVEPITAPVDETPAADAATGPEAAAVETPEPTPVEVSAVEQPEISVDAEPTPTDAVDAAAVDAEPAAKDDVDQAVEVDVDERPESAADTTTDTVRTETLLEVVDVVEVPAVEDRDQVDDEKHPVEVERETPSAAVPSTTSKELVTVPSEPEAGGQPSRVHRLVQRVRQTTTVVALVAVIGVLTAAGIAGVEATSHSDALARYALVSADLTEIRDDVRAALEEAQALGDLSAQVADESTTAALATAIERATELVEGEDPGAGSSWRYWTKAALSEQTDAVSSEITKAKAIAAALEGAVRAVNASHEAWAAEQDPADLAGAIAALSSAIDAATGVLAESDGRVGDNAVRQTLADAIAVATTVRDTAPPADAPAPERAAAAIAARDQTTALGAAQQAVTTARNTWEASQSAPAAQQPAPGTGNSSTGASTGTGAAAGSTNAGTATSAASGEFTVDAAAVPPSADRPGVATVQVAVSGNAGDSAAVLLTVAGITTQIGTVSGSGIVTGTAEGLPTGTWPWHVTVAGLQASGTPDIRVY